MSDLRLDSIISALDAAALSVAQARAAAVAMQKPASPVVGFVLREKSYWSNIKPFVDLMKTSHVAWNGVMGNSLAAYTDSRGWIKALPANTRARKLISTAPDEFSVNRTGTHYVRSSQPIKLGFEKTGTTTNLRQIAPNKAAVDVVQAIGGGNVLQIWVEHSNSTPLDIDSVQVYHADDESLLDADPHAFQASYLDSLRGAKRLRLSIWMNAVSGGLKGLETELPSIEVDYFGSETDCVPRCPPSMLCKLAKATGADIWLNFPAKTSPACMRAFAEAMKPAWPAGRRLMLEASGLEPWNFSWPYVAGSKWLSLEYSKTLTVVNKGGLPSTAEGDALACAIADQSLKLWAAFESVFGPAAVVRVFAGQGGWFDHLAAAFAYVDPATGRKFSEMVQVYAQSLYLGLRAGGEVASTDQGVMRESGAHNFPASWYQAAMLNDLPNMAKYLDANIAALLKINPAIRLDTYEWGNEYFVPFRHHTFTLASGALVSSTDISKLFTTGDQVVGAGGNHPSSAMNRYALPIAFCRINGNAMTLHPTQADALGNSNPYPLDIVAASFKFDNLTRVRGIDAKIKSELDGPFGAELYRRFYALCDGKLVGVLHHCDTAKYQLGESSGLKRSQYDKDTPRATLFRTLGGD